MHACINYFSTSFCPQPNCSCRVVTDDSGSKHIVICAKVDISPGMEITYDYQVEFWKGGRLNAMIEGGRQAVGRKGVSDIHVETCESDLIGESLVFLAHFCFFVSVIVCLCLFQCVSVFLPTCVCHRTAVQRGV